MFIRELSDIHFEMCPFFLPRMEGDSETVLVLSGDILTAKGMGMETVKGEYSEFLEDLNERFRAVIYVSGNHESYRYNINKTSATIRQFLTDYNLNNIHYLDCETKVIDDVAFIGATLWTDMDGGNPISMYSIQNGMNDFRVIRTGDQYRKFRPLDALGLHIKHKSFIFDECKKYHSEKMKTVVVSHHCPSYQLMTEEYRYSHLNGGYYSRMDDEIFENGPDVWFCGHTHSSHNITIGATNIIVNPRGYASRLGLNKYSDAKEVHDSGGILSEKTFSEIFHDENQNFNPYLRIEI